MKATLLKTITTIGLLGLMSFTLVQQNKITVYLIGDSTMANKQVKTYPETGWGMPFSWFFDQSVTVDNRAQNGRSTKSFIAEKRWEDVEKNLKEGDYVFIQFGHNDEVPTKKTYTPEAEFKANLVKFITETRNKKGVPVLLTPVARRKFDASGNVQGTHDTYSELVRQVAKEQNVPMIDLDKEWQAVLQKYGVENSKMLFNHLAPGENPNYPDGKMDDTHFNELGARKVAQIVLADIRTLKLDLANRIVKGANAPTVAPAAK
ncbi:GntR family transcriptional regulator [Mucilaginibacter sp. PPCGB 2223]|uniref:rhamnogalacturonan acetylesterase n=1 Tax=Mucilaginibacter sp. PPCGB 2223 TaxID=1886027 RepID=UPI0008247108|nr:rhamnogalacturonan acetylesterase [Mucilaginibacter sp. PPCGB 2223]OCX50400.1 GntR family transcriptional regulator [Mucilaginibacter sp. PPCGB 2223]